MHFETFAPYWTGVYEGKDDVVAWILRERLRMVLNLVDKTRLPRHTRALEVGCGAGHAAVSLVKRGFEVYAVDAAPTMINLTKRRLLETIPHEAARCTLADVYTLPFFDGAFDLVLAIGVLPWLPSTRQAVVELCRLLRPGGHLIVTVDSRWSLRRLLDPLSNPLLRPLKEAAKSVLRGLHRLQEKARPHRIAISHFDTVLKGAGVHRVDGFTLGFGPFTFLGRELLPRRLSLKLHSALQAWADRGLPVIRLSGAEYIVRAIKPG